MVQMSSERENLQSRKFQSTLKWSPSPARSHKGVRGTYVNRHAAVDAFETQSKKQIEQRPILLDKASKHETKSFQSVAPDWALEHSVREKPYRD